MSDKDTKAKDIKRGVEAKKDFHDMTVAEMMADEKKYKSGRKGVFNE